MLLTCEGNFNLYIVGFQILNCHLDFRLHTERTWSGLEVCLQDPKQTEVDLLVETLHEQFAREQAGLSKIASVLFTKFNELNEVD